MRPTREHATSNRQTYFVSSQTADRKCFFRNERWAKLMIEVLYHYRGKGYRLHDFVVMHDHLHILITPTESLEKAAQLIKGEFSYRAKKEFEYNWEIWQKGYTDHRIRDAADYQKYVHYIHQNPVKAGYCRKPEEYPYTSAHPGFQLDAVPQGLKPGFQGAVTGAAGVTEYVSQEFRTVGGDSHDR